MPPNAPAIDQPVVLEHLWQPIERELEEVEAILERELTSEAPFVESLLQYVRGFGGKRLRPALLLLTAQAVGEVREEHLLLGAVVEMIHTATLVHDDILDQAELRRHRHTVHRRWNSEAAVLLGDYLFTHAFSLASSLASPYACRRIGQATNTVCYGELVQVGRRGDLDLSQADYLAIIEAKTASLCACSCHLGAYFAQADAERIRHLEQYGRLLGIAFQIVDDLLDLRGEEYRTGKSLGADLRDGKPTLPVILARQRHDPALWQQLSSLLAHPDSRRDQLRRLLSECGAVEQAHRAACEYADRAAAHLNALDPSPARQALKRLARFVTDRQR